MVRAVPAIRRDPLAFLARTVARHGDLVAFPMPGRAVLLVDRPALAWQVLAAGARGWSKDTPQYGALSAVTGGGLLTSDGNAWRERRRMARPAYGHGALHAVARAATSAGRRVAEQVPPGGGVVDVERLLLSATLDVVAEALFGSAGVGDGRRLVRAVLAALDVVVARVRTPLPVPRWAPTPANRRLRRAVVALDRTCAALVAARRTADRAVGDQGVGGPEPDQDLLGVLLAAVDAGDLDAEGLRDELVTTVIAGHETVATSLVWTLDLLARHPAEQSAVHAELDAVLGAPGSPARDPGWDDLGRLVRTRAVVDEALRLYPPAWVITRRATAEHVLDGLVVPAGTLVVLSPWLLHRDAGAFPDPGRFDPDRFGPDAPVPPRGSYLPFGAGPRTCIGRELAVVESVLLVAALLRTHRVDPAVPGASPRRTDALVTLRPHGGLPLWVGPR